MARFTVPQNGLIQPKKRVLAAPAGSAAGLPGLVKSWESQGLAVSFTVCHLMPPMVQTGNPEQGQGHNPSTCEAVPKLASERTRPLAAGSPAWGCRVPFPAAP